MRSAPMSDTLHSWAQQPVESDAAYARFLIYRNLGPERSLRSAFVAAMGGPQKAAKRLQRLPGHWMRDSQRWNWTQRAKCWDVWTLKEEGRDACRLFFQGVGKALQQVVETL